MMISNQEQLLLFLRCLGCGVWLDLGWELIGVVQFLAKPSRRVLFVQDALLTACSGPVLFLFALAADGGEIRAVMLVAIGVGMSVSHMTAGRLLSAASRRFARLLPPLRAFYGRCRQKGAVIGEKIRKKVVFFYKKGLQSRPFWVYNRNHK